MEYRMAARDYRIESDSMGELKVPAEALWGAQTQRAVQNFPISGLTIPRPFIRALGLIKWAAAGVNEELGGLDAERAHAIQTAALAVADGTHDTHFPIDVFQTGSGTSSNMNANEVISRLATTDTLTVHANDHVNMSQSSNDVIPTAIHVSAALELHENLLPALAHLSSELQKKAVECAAVVKTGRTHLMDAMPVSLGQEISGWQSQVDLAVERIADSLGRMCRLAQGGTAVGTGINADPEFGGKVAALLAGKTGVPFVSGDNHFAGLASQDTAVEMSGQLRALAVGLMKISNDLRLMNSGPLAGLGEISLPALQPGSSIMPGKVNPVVPEAVCMVAAQVMGNDAAIAIAGQAGNFELNVMLPVIAHNLLQSIGILAGASRVLADSAIASFPVNEEHISAVLARNPILVTALNPIIGYEKGAAIAKKAYREGRSVLDVADEETDLSREELEKLLDPKALTEGGIKS